MNKPVIEEMSPEDKIRYGLAHPGEEKQESQGLTPKEWEKEYSKETPHWAEDRDPSEFVQDFAVELKKRKAKSVLEIGCGNGRDSIFLAKAGFDVTAVDVAPSAIELAEANIKKAEVKVRTKVANAEKLPFRDKEFNAVFSLSVLHATDLDKSLAEVSRVLKPGGYAFIYIYGNTQFADGKEEEIISVDGYIRLLEIMNFRLLDFYTEDEEEFDEFGEKHKLLVAFLERR